MSRERENGPASASRPAIVRADTIDLQDHAAPSAKDHTRRHNQVTKPASATSAPPVAPHQAETLREIAIEAAEEQTTNPPLSWDDATDGAGRQMPQQYPPHDSDDDDDFPPRRPLHQTHDQGLDGDPEGDVYGIEMYLQEEDEQQQQRRQQQQQQQQQQEQQHSLGTSQQGQASADDADVGLDGDADLDLDDDLLDKISSSPSIEDEDIDFEFVYALHTFVATVEGQANATKGDTMVLLDDSNSYWWLVRVVKDSSIGYLPAEHIETPTERLARLNKHRNIDLSATMLGDQAQKQKTSFKAIRRRRKTVTFADPTYVDYSDFDYSSDEEDIEELFGPPSAMVEQQQSDQMSQQEDQQLQLQQQQQQQQQLLLQQSEEPLQEHQSQQTLLQQQSLLQQAAVRSPADDEIADEGAAVAPLRPRPTVDDGTSEMANEEAADGHEMGSSGDVTENKTESRSRNGTVRNTDSFFKDESLETKKITLTPNLLRDDTTSRESSESAPRDLKSGSMMEKADKELVSDKEKKRGKERDKKEKDKKPSAIRSFFSRKDKKKASEEDEEPLPGRVPAEPSSAEARDGDDRAGAESTPAEKLAKSARHPSKLQKTAPGSKNTASGVHKSVEFWSYLAEGRTNDVSTVPPSSMRLVDATTPESQQQSLPTKSEQGQPSREAPPPQPSGLMNVSQVENPVSSEAMSAREGGLGLTPGSSGPDAHDKDAADAIIPGADLGGATSDGLPAEVSLTERRTDAPLDRGLAGQGQAGKREADSQSGLPGAYPDVQPVVSTTGGRKQGPSRPLQDRQRTESGQRTAGPAVHTSNPPALVVDTSSPEGNSPEASPSPEPRQAAGNAAAEQVSTSCPKEPFSWDDMKLRAFFDESDHVRDLLAVVYDKSDVEPAGSDHPIVGGLFREQNAKLAEITTQLDNMLGDWLARKQRLRGSI